MYIFKEYNLRLRYMFTLWRDQQDEVKRLHHHLYVVTAACVEKILLKTYPLSNFQVFNPVSSTMLYVGSPKIVHLVQPKLCGLWPPFLHPPHLPTSCPCKPHSTLSFYEIYYFRFHRSVSLCSIPLSVSDLFTQHNVL